MPYTPSPINGLQFGEQHGLFSEDHPAMRRRTVPEMTPDQFKAQPDTFFHGTFREEMPKGPTTPEAAGIHLGTLASAQDRIDTFGERHTPREGKFGQPDFSADIHARRLHPSVKYAPPGGARDARYGIDMIMEGSPDRPRPDLGHRWDRTNGDYDFGSDRSAHEFGEYYRNDTEDAGSVSIRVPDAGYLDSHRDAIDRAIRKGEPVHPLNRGLIQNHGGAGIDEPIRYKAGERWDDEDESWKHEEIDEHGANVAGSDPHQPMLLPYKLRSNRDYTPGAGNAFFHADTTVEPRYGNRIKSAAVTFTGSYEEAKAKTEVADAPQAPTAAPGRRTLSSEEVSRGRRPATAPRPAQAEWRKDFNLSPGHPALSSQFNR